MVRDSNTADSWLRRRPFTVDVLIAAVLALLALPTTLNLIWISDWEAPGRIALSAVVALAHSAVALRRARPRSAFTVVSLAALTLTLSPDLGGGAAAQVGGAFAPILLPSSITFPVILYAVAAYGQRREPTLALAVALIGAVAATLRLWGAGTGTAGIPAGNAWHLFVFGSLLCAVVAPWALGRFRNVHEAYVDTLEERARRGDQDRADEAVRATTLERSRIAREMHDVVAHSLSVMVSQAEGGRLAARRDPAITLPVLATIATTGREALTEMRELLDVLGAPDNPERDRTPQPALSDLDALVDRVRDSGTPIDVTVGGTPGELGRLGELTAYRVIQEALTNVVKHAGPGARATIDLDWSSDDLVIRASDDGHSDGPADRVESAQETGRGLTGMRERIELIGGDLTVGPDTVSGYRVRARIPVAGRTGAPR